MYKIIGADGKEYGPVSLEEFRLWVAQGRIDAQTKVLPEGSTEWRRVADIPELAACLPIAATATPPPAFTGNLTTIRNTVQAPAIFLLILSVLDIFASLLGMAGSLFQFAMPNFLNIPQQEAELQQQFTFLFSLPANVIGLGIAIICLFGSLRMMQLRSYGLAMTSAILIMLPCGTCCCCLNVFAGIWALIVLSKAEVRSVFQ